MRITKILPALVLMSACTAVILAGCKKISPTASPTLAPAPTIVPSPTAHPDAAVQPWWRTTVFYEIFVRSFYDSDGDGIGDFRGLREKLDYLNDGNPDTRNDLGITGIWLMPIHPSPSYHGYDVVNYYAINPEYGNMADFRELLAQAHQRGIRVIIDLVLNHTSSQHPFFIDARSSLDSPYHDWYLWSDNQTGQGWHSTQVGGQALSYYGYFCDCMPDLNYANPDVTAQMEQVSAFWLEDVGVDGFRIDAAKHLIENGQASVTNSPETHAWFKSYYDFYKGINPDAYAVGEVTSGDARLSAQYGSGELDQIFSFEMASGVMNSVNGGGVSAIGSAVAFTLKDNPEWNFATFLTNHDQERVMSVFGGSLEKARTAAFILLTSPGTPFIYYGEEIGMTGEKPDEDIRRPMQWTDSATAGFTSGMPWEEVHADAVDINVAREQSQPGSLLSTYRDLIALRNSYPALSSGGYQVVDTGSRKVYAFIRTSDRQAILAVANLTNETINDYALAGKIPGLADGSHALEAIFGEAVQAASLDGASGTFSGFRPLPELSPYQTALFNVSP